MNISYRNIPQLLIAGLISLAAALPAYAIDLHPAKAQGLVGETTSGYLAAVKPSAEVNALVGSINSQRKAVYAEIAKRNGTSLQAVEALAGKKAIQKTPGGQYVNTGGGWSKK